MWSVFSSQRLARVRALRGPTEKPNPKGYACSLCARIGFWIRWRNSRTDSLFRLQHHHRYCYWLRFAGCRLDHCQSHQGRFARYWRSPLSKGGPPPLPTPPLPIPPSHPSFFMPPHKRPAIPVTGALGLVILFGGRNIAGPLAAGPKIDTLGPFAATAPAPPLAT